MLLVQKIELIVVDCADIKTEIDQVDDILDRNRNIQALLIHTHTHMHTHTHKHTYTHTHIHTHTHTHTDKILFDGLDTPSRGERTKTTD